MNGKVKIEKLNENLLKETRTKSELPVIRSNNFISTYANTIKVNASPYDVSILFSSLTADGIEERVMIQMSIQGLKRIAKTLSDIASDWDKEFSDKE